jgi:hypothetical protein
MKTPWLDMTGGAKLARPKLSILHGFDQRPQKCHFSEIQHHLFFLRLCDLGGGENVWVGPSCPPPEGNSV